jgi:hypothetical protein
MSGKLAEELTVEQVQVILKSKPLFFYSVKL